MKGPKFPRVDDLSEDGLVNIGSSDDELAGGEEIISKSSRYKRTSNVAMLEAKLSEDNIKKTNRKYRCHNCCLCSLSLPEIREACSKSLRQKSQDRSLSFQWLVKQEENKEGKSQRVYTVEQKKVCRRAFKEVYCVGNHRLDRIYCSIEGQRVRVLITDGTPTLNDKACFSELVENIC